MVDLTFNLLLRQKNNRSQMRSLNLRRFETCLLNRRNGKPNRSPIKQPF